MIAETSCAVTSLLTSRLICFSFGRRRWQKQLLATSDLCFVMCCVLLKMWRCNHDGWFVGVAEGNDKAKSASASLPSVKLAKVSVYYVCRPVGSYGAECTLAPTNELCPPPINGPVPHKPWYIIASSSLTQSLTLETFKSETSYKCVNSAHYIGQKSHFSVCQKCCVIKNMPKMRFWWGLCPGPRWGSTQRICPIEEVCI